MTHAMRPSTLETLGLGSVFDIFTRGGLPAQAKKCRFGALAKAMG